MDNLITQEEQVYLSELEGRVGFEQAEAEKQALISKRNDMKTLLASASGRRIVWDMLATTNVFGLSHTGNSTTYYNEGRRSVGLELMAEVIAADPNAWIQMQKDNLTEMQRALSDNS